MKQSLPTKKTVMSSCLFALVWFGAITHCVRSNSWKETIGSFGTSDHVQEPFKGQPHLGRKGLEREDLFGGEHDVDFLDRKLRGKKGKRSKGSSDNIGCIPLDSTPSPTKGKGKKSPGRGSKSSRSKSQGRFIKRDLLDHGFSAEFDRALRKKAGKTSASKGGKNSIKRATKKSKKGKGSSTNAPSFFCSEMPSLAPALGETSSPTSSPTAPPTSAPTSSSFPSSAPVTCTSTTVQLSNSVGGGFDLVSTTPSTCGTKATSGIINDDALKINSEVFAFSPTLTDGVCYTVTVTNNNCNSDSVRALVFINISTNAPGGAVVPAGAGSTATFSFTAEAGFEQFRMYGNAQGDVGCSVDVFVEDPSGGCIGLV